MSRKTNMEQVQDLRQYKKRAETTMRLFKLKANKTARKLQLSGEARIKKKVFSTICFIFLFLHSAIFNQLHLHRFKVNKYTFRGSNSFIFMFSSHFIWGQLVKKRICSRRSKFFPLRVDHILKGLHCPGK